MHSNYFFVIRSALGENVQVTVATITIKPYMEEVNFFPCFRTVDEPW